jgi:hypothetical protein
MMDHVRSQVTASIYVLLCGIRVKAMGEVLMPLCAVKNRFTDLEKRNVRKTVNSDERT